MLKNREIFSHFFRSDLELSFKFRREMLMVFLTSQGPKYSVTFQLREIFPILSLLRVCFLCECVCEYVRVCVCMGEYVCVYVYMCMCVCVYVYMCVCVCVCECFI